MQVVTEYKSEQIDTVLDCLERMQAHLTVSAPKVCHVQPTTWMQLQFTFMLLLESTLFVLQAAVVSNDPQFNNYVLGRTVNGTTYVGLRARTTGALGVLPLPLHSHQQHLAAGRLHFIHSQPSLVRRALMAVICAPLPLLQARPRTTGLAPRATPVAQASAPRRPSSWCVRARPHQSSFREARLCPECLYPFLGFSLTGAIDRSLSLSPPL